MSELLTIEGKHRVQTGKSYTRKLRANGMLPAVLLEKGKATSLEINPKLLPKIYKAGKIFNLALESKVLKVRVQELQIDRIKRLPLHIDLMLVD